MNKLDNIFIEPTIKSPQVDFNSHTGDLILSGKSIPENANIVYEPLLKWIKNYIQHPKETTHLRINLDYFNTSTSIWIAKMVKTLSKIGIPGTTLFIHMYFSAEEFESMDTEDLKESLAPVIDLIKEPVVNIGIKIYGKGNNNEILRESMILL